MYWGALIAIDSLLNSNLNPKIEIFNDKTEWVVKIDDVLYRKKDQNKKRFSVKNKGLETYHYIRLKKTSYGTQQIEVRTNLKSPWFLVNETRGKIKVIDDSKGVVKIVEDHQTKVYQLKTGRSIISSSAIKGKVIGDEYLILWSQKSEEISPLIYKLPEMDLVEVKVRIQDKQPVQGVEL